MPLLACLMKLDVNQSLDVCRPVEKRERSLQHSGPTWKAPMLQDVLYNLPFLRHSPKSMIEVAWPTALHVRSQTIHA